MGKEDLANDDYDQFASGMIVSCVLDNQFLGKLVFFPQ